MAPVQDKTSFKKMFLVDENLFNKMKQQQVTNNVSSDESVPTLSAPAAITTEPELQQQQQEQTQTAADDKIHENDVVIQPNSNPTNPAPESAETAEEQAPLPSRDVTGGELTPAKPKLTVNYQDQGGDMIQDKPAEAVATRPSQSDACKSACRLCGKEVSNLTALNDHFSQEHNNVITKYPECKVCRSFFENQTLLDKHVERVHDSDNRRGIKRKERGEDYDSEDNEINDLVDIDKEEKVAPPKKKKAKNKQDLVLVADSDGMFSCNSCDKRYVRKHNLINHMTKVHANGGNNGNNQKISLNDALTYERGPRKRKISPISYDNNGDNVNNDDDDDDPFAKRMKMLKARRGRR